MGLTAWLVHICPEEVLGEVGQVPDQFLAPPSRRCLTRHAADGATAPLIPGVIPFLQPGTQ